jgi:hypothetical protein
LSANKGSSLQASARPRGGQVGEGPTEQGDATSEPGPRSEPPGDDAMDVDVQAQDGNRAVVRSHTLVSCLSIQK